MKLLILVLSLLTAASAHAKNYSFKGDDARKLMETLAGAGFEVSNAQQEWGGKTLVIHTNEVFCHYTAVSHPDDWMSNVDCYKGTDQSGPKLANPLALAQALAPYATQEAGLGNRWLNVNSVSCSLVYDKRKYDCVISAEESPR